MTWGYRKPPDSVPLTRGGRDYSYGSRGTDLSHIGECEVVRDHSQLDIQATMIQSNDTPTAISTPRILQLESVLASTGLFFSTYLRVSR